MAHGRNLEQRLNKARLEKPYRRERLTFSQIGGALWGAAAGGAGADGRIFDTAATARGSTAST